MSKFVTTFASILLIANLATASLGAQEEKQIQVTQQGIAMANAFEQNLGRALSAEELTAINAFLQRSALLGSKLDTQVVNNGMATSFTKILFCLEAKGAIFVKIGAGICLDTQANVFILGASGVGLSFGVAGAGTILVYKGPSNDIRGKYIGFQAGAADLILNKAASILKNVYSVVGGHVGYMTNPSNDATLFMAGVLVGGMIDLSEQELIIK